MARMLTEEEVEKLEKQRELQQRESKALAGMSPDSAMRYREAQERQHWDDLHRQTHGGLSRGEVLALGPDGSGRQARGIARAAELQTAREHELGMQKNELETRKYEAEQKRYGMEGQGVGVAKLRYGTTDYDGKYTPGGEIRLAEQQNADKEKQRQHELAMLGQTQTFQGTQNTAERQNKLEIAQTQGKSAVEAARAQAEARAADIAAKNDIEREKIAARKEIASMRVNGQLNQAGAARLSKAYNGLVGAGYSPARIRQMLLEEGWSAEEIASAQGRQQGQ